MCIIVYKPAHANMPNRDVLRRCFASNPHGAGIMTVSRAGEVQIEKGFMTFDEFEREYDKLDPDSDIVFHFRLATHGLIVRGNTHPFPISRNLLDLTRLSLTTSVGIAHNGILNIETRNKYISDTQEFIMSRLLDTDSYDEIVQKSCEASGKFLIMSSEMITMTGGGWIVEDDVYYSNSSYKQSTVYDLLYTDLSTKCAACTTYECLTCYEYLTCEEDNEC